MNIEHRTSNIEHRTLKIFLFLKEIFYLPELPNELFSIVESYTPLPKGTFRQLNRETLPELPLDLRRIISSYTPPVTQEDLVVLYSLDPSGKSFYWVFQTKDLQRISDIIRLIELPESDEDSFREKLRISLLLDYYPVIRHLFYRSLEMKIPLGNDLADNITRRAINAKDLQTALDVSQEYLPYTSTYIDMFKLAVDLEAYNIALKIATKLDMVDIDRIFEEYIRDGNHRAAFFMTIEFEFQKFPKERKGKFVKLLKQKG